MKKLTIIFLCSFLVISPLFNIGGFSYADATGPDDIEWIPFNSQVNQSVTVAIYKAYLWQRSATMQVILGDSYDDFEKAYSQFSYDMYTKINKQYNLNIPYGQIYYYMSDNAPLQFLYTASGLQTLDNFYVAWKDYYNINENENKEVYNGEWFEDSDGYGCYVTIPNTSIINNTTSNPISKIGTPYRFTGISLFESITQNTIENYTINYKINDTSGSTSYSISNYYNNYGPTYHVNFSNNNFSQPTEDTLYINGKRGTTTYTYKNGFVAIFKYDHKYYLGSYANYNVSGVNSYSLHCKYLLTDTTGAVSAAVSVAQGALKNLQVAEGKGAIINTGKTGADAIKQFIEDDEDTTEVQEVDNPSEGETPTTPPITPDTPSSGSLNTGLSQDANGNFNFSMPDLNLNWSIDSPVINIFPFSIPFDLYRAYQKINIEGVAPHYTGTIDLIVYQWNVDFDLSQFDDFAADIRKWILFFYIIGLIIATRSIMHIY